MYDEGSDGFGLYLGEVSTSDGLALFDPTAPITVVSFGATGYGHLGWTTEEHLPPLFTVGAMRAFLDGHAGLGLVDFEARLGDDVSLASHDDDECHIRFRERPALMAVLTHVVPPMNGGALIHAIVTNPGSYVTSESAGNVVTYATFEAYVARQPRRRR